MDPLSSILMAGTSLASGFGSFLGGQRSARSSRRAADIIAEAERAEAIARRQAVADYQTQTQGYLDEYNPYIRGGGRAQSELEALMGLSGAGEQQGAFDRFTTSPGYQFRFDQGLGALDRSAAARGMGQSGAAIKAAQRYGQGLASSEYDDYYRRLAAMSGSGLSATSSRAGQGIGAAGNALQGMIGAAQAQTAAATPIAQGMMASTGYRNQGLQGLLQGFGGAAGQLAGSGFPTASSYADMGGWSRPGMNAASVRF